jgi:hypothetical protein
MVQETAPIAMKQPVANPELLVPKLFSAGIVWIASCSGSGTDVAVFVRWPAAIAGIHP